MQPQVIREPTWTFKLLPDALKKLGIEPKGIIHIGAHHGEEVPVYLELGFNPIVLVEPDPENFNKLGKQDWFGLEQVHAMQVAVAAQEGTATFYRNTVSVYSGLVENTMRPNRETFEVLTIPASYIQKTFLANVMVIDTQGTELEVLSSADLSALDLIIIETQTISRDRYAVYEPDLVKFATEHGWRLGIVWVRERGWTDTLLVKKG